MLKKKRDATLHITTKADKLNAVVIMNKDDCQKMEIFLEDRQTYLYVNRNHVENVVAF